MPKKENNRKNYSANEVWRQRKREANVLKADNQCAWRFEQLVTRQKEVRLKEKNVKELERVSNALT